MSDELKAYLYFDVVLIGAALFGYFVGPWLVRVLT